MNKSSKLFVPPSERKPLFKLTLFAVVVAALVIILGAFTRLADAGLGCPDWPGCYGHLLWPNETAEIQQAEKLFPDAPVELDKTWPEMVHRYFAGFLGLVVLAIAVLSVRYRKQLGTSQPMKLALFLLVMVVVQAAFGMWTVTLKLWPQVVTAHLLGGFTTITLLWLLAQRLGGATWQLMPRQALLLSRLRFMLWSVFVLVVAQIALGGWVSANYAATACIDFPQCQAAWVPEMDMKSAFNVMQSIGPNYLGGQLDSAARTAIHVTHRLGALVLTIAIVVVGIALLASKIKQVRPWVYCLWLVLAVQIALGITNVLAHLPLPVAVAHNGVAAVLLMTVVTLLHRLNTITIKNDAYE